MADSAAPSTGRVFISYRREETAYAAGWLFDRLADRFGRDQIFKDIDSIQLGADFVELEVLMQAETLDRPGCDRRQGVDRIVCRAPGVLHLFTELSNAVADATPLLNINAARLARTTRIKLSWKT
jgi:hypothetical protein